MEANQSLHDGPRLATRDGTRHATSLSDGPPASPTGTSSSEDLFVRNYDVERTYNLELTATHRCDDDQLERQYTLQPGQVIAELGVLAPGEYELTVEIAHTDAVSSCTVGPTPDETAVVEVGNGTVSVSQGLY